MGADVPPAGGLSLRRSACMAYSSLVGLDDRNFLFSYSLK
jgi:hypothetical protein